MTRKVFAVVGICFLALLSSCSSQGVFDSFAQCLAEKQITMYGTEWCPHCKTQKSLFGSSFQYASYVDCDRYQEQCLAAGVQAYPTWIVNGTAYEGVQSMVKLSQISGCELPK